MSVGLTLLLTLVAGGCFEYFLFLFLGSDVQLPGLLMVLVGHYGGVQLVSGCVVSTWVVDGAGGA